MFKVSLRYEQALLFTHAFVRRARENFKIERMSKKVWDGYLGARGLGRGMAFPGDGLRPGAVANSQWLASFLKRTVVCDGEDVL